MARNEEKANAVLNRFWAAKQEEKRKPKQKRPYLASECRDLADADKWRQQILREIGRKVMEIQNPGLGEHRIKDLNDEINKLIREKGHWEVRIVELGGPNYAKQAPKVEGGEGEDGGLEADTTGKGLGYRYFGAAKNLPGVKELFEAPAPPATKRSRYGLYKRIDMDYYGFRDEEDGLLVRLEGEAEQHWHERVRGEWEEMERLKAEARKNVKSGEEASVRVAAGAAVDSLTGGEAGEAVAVVESDIEREIAEGRGRESGEHGAEADAAGGTQFVAHVPLPDEREIERMVLAKKKAELLKKYASDELVEEEREAKSLLNIRS